MTPSSGQYVPRRSGGFIKPIHFVPIPEDLLAPLPSHSWDFYALFHGIVGRSLLVVVISLSRHSFMSTSLPKHFVVAAFARQRRCPNTFTVVAAYGATDTGINSIHSIHIVVAGLCSSAAAFQKSTPMVARIICSAVAPRLFFFTET
jgi:hypothetical protein